MSSAPVEPDNLLDPSGGMAPATLYEHTDIPRGMTCAEYRRALARPQKPSRLAKVGLALLYPARVIAHLGEGPVGGRLRKPP